MCPEIVKNEKYSALKADIFAAGVILFVFYSGHPPFVNASRKDPYYQMFMKYNSKFWKFH